MTYDEAIEATVSFANAKQEIEAHGLSMADFAADHGEADEYAGVDVLTWLGY